MKISRVCAFESLNIVGRANLDVLFIPVSYISIAERQSPVLTSNWKTRLFYSLRFHVKRCICGVLREIVRATKFRRTRSFYCGFGEKEMREIRKRGVWSLSRRVRKIGQQGRHFCRIHIKLIPTVKVWSMFPDFLQMSTKCGGTNEIFRIYCARYYSNAGNEK